jgi:hypothetical protein
MREQKDLVLANPAAIARVSPRFIADRRSPVQSVLPACVLETVSRNNLPRNVFETIDKENASPAEL